jgi:hypothetical protein
MRNPNIGTGLARKFVSGALAGTLALGLAGCGGDKETGAANSDPGVGVGVEWAEMGMTPPADVDDTGDTSDTGEDGTGDYKITGGLNGHTQAEYDMAKAAAIEEASRLDEKDYDIREIVIFPPEYPDQACAILNTSPDGVGGWAVLMWPLE